ncbi:hypothetical protein [Serratia sp. M24T3]|uniref:hypothetical protein n=1 Tax=Serratia sp. M24T3 TaxID=932213 RepID=UPI0012F4BF0E|nr:hypothetical protein [Serratia sp. M24T3]
MLVITRNLFYYKKYPDGVMPIIGVNQASVKSQPITPEATDSLSSARSGGYSQYTNNFNLEVRDETNSPE